MSNLSQAVQEAIQGNLPGLVATELKEFIAQAEKDAANVQRLNDMIGSRDRIIADLRATLDQHKELAVREAAVEAAEKSLRDQELAILKREAYLDAKTAQAELQGVKETAALFLRNTIFRESVISDVAKPVEGMSPNGTNSYGHPGHLQRDARPDTVTTTRESE